MESGAPAAVERILVKGEGTAGRCEMYSERSALASLEPHAETIPLSSYIVRIGPNPAAISTGSGTFFSGLEAPTHHPKAVVYAPLRWWQTVTVRRAGSLRAVVPTATTRITARAGGWARWIDPACIDGSIPVPAPLMHIASNVAQAVTNRRKTTRRTRVGRSARAVARMVAIQGSA